MARHLEYFACGCPHDHKRVVSHDEKLSPWGVGRHHVTEPLRTTPTAVSHDQAVRISAAVAMDSGSGARAVYVTRHAHVDHQTTRDKFAAWVEEDQSISGFVRVWRASSRPALHQLAGIWVRLTSREPAPVPPFALDLACRYPSCWRGHHRAHLPCTGPIVRDRVITVQLYMRHLRHRIRAGLHWSPAHEHAAHYFPIRQSPTLICRAPRQITGCRFPHTPQTARPLSTVHRVPHGSLSWEYAPAVASKLSGVCWYFTAWASHQSCR